jgi:hypothetical protein
MSAILVDENLQQEEDVSASAIEAANNLNPMRLGLEDVKEELDGESASIRPGDNQDFMNSDDSFAEVVDDLATGERP